VDSKVSPGRKKRRPNFSAEFRKALAQRACEPGVSVSQLAQENDVNVNMLFKWRRYLLAGKFDTAERAPVMLPVTIIDTQLPELPITKAKRAAKLEIAQDANAARPGVIEIQIAGATIRFDGQADLATVRALVRMLRP
jgi:transposase